MPPKPPLTADELHELRLRLDEIDASIIDLIAERQDVVNAIGEYKLRTGAPLRHYAREREVIDRGMERAQSLGLSDRVAREILETLIHHSLGKQETYQLAQSEHGQGKRALVIGGLGRMGLWMARFLDMVGYRVDVADPAEAESPFERIEEWEDQIDEYDLVVVAVPLRPTAGGITARGAGIRYRLAQEPAPHRAGRPQESGLPRLLRSPDVRAG
jgi:chorismate mutase